MKRLAELHLKLNPLFPTEMTIGFEKWEARIQDKIVDLTMELYIGSPIEKIRALGNLAKSAHLARDKDLVMKAMDKLRQLAEDTKLEYMRRCYDTFEIGFSQCSREFSSGIPPERREIDYFFELFHD